MTINCVQVLSRRLYKRADDDSLYALSFPWMHTLHCTTCMHEMPSCPPLQPHLICCMRAMQPTMDFEHHPTLRLSALDASFLADVGRRRR